MTGFAITSPGDSYHRHFSANSIETMLSGASSLQEQIGLVLNWKTTQNWAMVFTKCMRRISPASADEGLD